MSWTPDRPTKPGKYEVYLEPSQRSRMYPGYAIVDLNERAMHGLERDALYNGALWRPYVEPADPHVQPAPQPDDIGLLIAALRRAETERDEALKQSAGWEIQAQDMRDRLVKAEAERDAQHDLVLRLTAERDAVSVVHACPPKGSGVMPCCGATPFEKQGERLAHANQLQADIEAEQQAVVGVVPADVHERGWQWRPTATDTAFAPPFGTIRQCRVCGCLVAGGPTACARCAEAGA